MKTNRLVRYIMQGIVICCVLSLAVLVYTSLNPGAVWESIGYRISGALMGSAVFLPALVTLSDK